MCDSSNRSAAYCEMELFKTAFKARPPFLPPPKAPMHDPISSCLFSLVTFLPWPSSPFFLLPSAPLSCTLISNQQKASDPAQKPKLGCTFADIFDACHLRLNRTQKPPSPLPPTIPGPSFAKVGVAIHIQHGGDTHKDTCKHTHTHTHTFTYMEALIGFCIVSCLPLLYPLSSSSLPRFFPPSLSRSLISSSASPSSNCSRGAWTQERGIRGYGQCAPQHRWRPRGVQGPSRKAIWRPRPPPPCPFLPCPCDDAPPLLLALCPQAFSASSSSSSPKGSQARGSFQAFAGTQGSNGSCCVIAQHGCGGERQCDCSCNEASAGHQD
jgi:hypothetical protein